MRHVQAVQDTNFGEIVITKSEDDNDGRDDDLPQGAPKIIEEPMFEDF